jgi:AsmA protein
MKRVLKWVGILFGIFVLVIIAAVIILPRVIDVQQYKPMLESKVSELTGRPLSVAGDVKLSVFPWLGVSFADVTLGSPKGFAEKEFASIKSLDAKVKLLPLLSRNLWLTAVADEPKILAVKNKDGSVNWSFAKDTPPKPKEEKAPAEKFELPFKTVTIGELALKNGSARFIDHASGARHAITDINIALTDVTLDSPIKLTLSALLDNKPLSVVGDIGPVGKTIGKEPIEIDITVDALKEIQMTLKGQVENAMADPTAKMAVDLSEFSPRQLMEALGLALPVQTADPDALGKVSLSADVTASAKAVAVSNGNMVLDDSRLAFNLKASEFSRPKVAFDLNLDRIDLDRYLPPPAEKPAAADKEGGTSQPAAKPDFTPLRKLIMDGTVNIGNLTVKKAKLSSIMLKINARNGVIQLDPIKMALYDGSFSGKTTVNVKTDTPATHLSADLQGVQVNPLMQDVMSKDILEGSTKAQVTISMAGADAAAIKRTLNGEGQLTFNDGAIKGFDLAAMARNTKAAFGLEKKADQRPKTDFAELSIPFTIKNGLFNTPLAALKSPLLRLEAKGDAHLAEETLDFRVDPKVVATLKGQGDEQERTGLLVPVIVSGTFSAPRFKPDMEALAKQTLDVDKEELEAKARETIDQKAQEALGEKSGVVKDLLGQDKESGETSSEPSGDKEKSQESPKDLVKGLFKKD